MGPENRMLNRLKPKLERDLRWHIEKTHNLYRSGRPDWDIFRKPGLCGFIEAKHWDKRAKHSEIVNPKQLIDKCSDMQKEWLFARADTKHRVAILCGFNTHNAYAFLSINDRDKYIGGVFVVCYSRLIVLLDQWLKNESEKTI